MNKRMWTWYWFAYASSEYPDKSVHSNNRVRAFASRTVDGPRRERTCLRGHGFRLSKTQTYLLRDYLEYWNFARSKFDALIILCRCTGWFAFVVRCNKIRFFLTSMPGCRSMGTHMVFWFLSHTWVACALQASPVETWMMANTKKAHIVTISIKISRLPWPLFW